MVSKRYSISYFAVLAALACGLLFPNLNRGGLSGYDDALYAHEGKQMLRGGDWWTVHFNGKPNFEYPPMFLWLEAASMKLLGANDYAAKLPSALAGLGTILVLYFLVAELTGDLWLAAVAMFCLTTSQLFIKYATHAMTDVPFTFFVTLALYLYVKAERKPWYLALAGMPIAAAILTRTIIGVFPLMVMAAHMLLGKRYKLLFSLPFATACLMALGLPLIWFGFPPPPEHVAFVTGKIGGVAFAPSIHMLDYAWMLLRFYWPWLPFVFIGAALELRARQFLPLLWIVLLLVPLSLASTKYARYLLPAFPALAMVAAAGVSRFVPPPRRVLFLRLGCAVLVLIIAFTLLFPSKERGVDMRTLAPIADRNTQPSERVLIYAGGELAYDIQNQFLWYANRYVSLVTDISKLANLHDTTVIIDKPSYPHLVSRTARDRFQLMAQSDKFLLVRFRPSSPSRN